jgi:hypothetical protein
MSLHHVDNEAIRQSEGFMFFMEVDKTNQTLRIFVKDEVLTGCEIATDQGDLRAQFEVERAEFEAIACEKYNHGRVTTDGLILIALPDIAGLTG